MKFADLQFYQNSNWLDGIHAHVKFPNGYGASIIQSAFSYGGLKGLYELAVLAGPQEKICYTTPITDNVLGHLTEEGVTEALIAIEALPFYTGG